MRLALAAAILGGASPAVAETRLAGGFMMSQPMAGASGGADYALVLHGERALRPDIDVGLTLEGGHAPGNADESLSRLAVMPTIGLRGTAGSLGLRADIALGWQLAHGTTSLAGRPVTGTEARGLRAEVGLGLEAEVATRIGVRARGGMALDGVYPASVRGKTTLTPLVELALVFAL